MNAQTTVVPSLLPKNSTTVRSKERELRLARLGFAALSLIAPERADEKAARLFFTPRRRAPRPAPAIEGIESRAADVHVLGERVATWTFGPSGAPAVLLAHGWEGHAGQMSRFIAPLVKAGHRVIAFDMPAHGASTGRETTVLQFARTIRAVADVLGPVRAIVAHSLGGTAAALAVRDGLQVERVVLIAPAVEPTHFARKMGEILALSPERTAGMMRRIEWRAGVPLTEVAISERLDTRASALILHDPEDEEVPWLHARTLADMWPGATLEELNDLGHRKPLRDPYVIDAAVRFIANVAR